MKRDFLLGGTKLPTGGAVRGAGGAMSPPVFMLKEALHFNRIVPKYSVFLCFLSGSVELMTSTQKKILRYVTIQLKWKTGLTVRHAIVASI